MTPIGSASAKDQLVRINDALRSPILLVGGMAVQQYRVVRNSKDLDLVADHDQVLETLQSLYPSHEWLMAEQNNNDIRPSYRIRHLSENLGEIIIGPKLTEREPYKYVDWSALVSHARPFRYQTKALNNILVPNPAGLAYTKLLSFIDRRFTAPPKAQQDLQDFVDLSNDTDFSPILFVAYVKQGKSAEYIGTQLSNITTPEAQLLAKSSVATIHQFLGAKDQKAVDHATAVADTPHEMSAIVKEVAKITFRHEAKYVRRAQARTALIVIGVQNDFFEGGALAAAETTSLLDPLNNVIRHADAAGMAIVFARDWHPPDHHSFPDWGVHCVAGSEGAAFHPRLYLPTEAITVNIGESNDADGYSPFADPRLLALMATDGLRVVYVVGIALEFCILAACRDAVWLNKTVIAVEPLIRAASRDHAERDHAWQLLTSLGVLRAQNVALSGIERTHKEIGSVSLTPSIPILTL